MEMLVNDGKHDECADSRKKRVVGNLTTYVEFALHLPLYLSRFIPPSFRLFLGLLTLFTEDKNLGELTEFPTFLRAGLFGYIDAFNVGEQKWSIATVPYTAIYLCFLYYYFWNFFAITETRLKCKKVGKTPSHLFTLA